MKKCIVFLLVGVGIISTGVAIGNAMWITRQKPVSVGIIGGADEPTSIFLAGKIGRKKEEIGRYRILSRQLEAKGKDKI